MAVKVYSEAEFKALVKGVFDSLTCLPSDVSIDDSDVDNAYDWATAQLAYDLPSSGDSQSPEKYKWLKNRMDSYLYNLLLVAYATISDFDKSKTRKIFDGFKDLRDMLEQDFLKYQIDIDSGAMVRGSGFTTNSFGEDTSYEHLEEINRESGSIDNIDT